jgi:hypothetical protein
LNTRDIIANNKGLELVESIILELRKRHLWQEVSNKINFPEFEELVKQYAVLKELDYSLLTQSRGENKPHNKRFRKEQKNWRRIGHLSKKCMVGWVKRLKGQINF